MPKILDYNTLTTAQGCNVLFMGDKASSSTNPEIKNITVDNLFKRESLSALNASGITFYDDGGNASLFIKDGGNVGVGGTTANYDLQVNGDFYVTGGIFDCTGASGSANQYLKSLGSGNYQWVDTSTLGGGTVSGSGSANYIPKWSSSSALTNSIIYEVSSKIGIGNCSPNATLHIEGSASGSDAIVQNATNGAVVELRRDSGTTVTNSLYLSNTGSGFSLGSSNSFANSNININSTGSLGVRTTTLSAALNVSTNQLLVGDFYSSHTSGSVIYFKNTSSCAYSNVVSYSNNDGAQKVNWITGTFEDGSSNKYFGIGYKNVNLSSPSCAKFDTTTVCNNLFYINTGGSASLAHNIHTHNKTDTGHNTGRFIHVVSLPIIHKGGTAICFILPPMGVNPRWYCTTLGASSYTFPSETEYSTNCGEYAYNSMPYDGIISSITGHVMNDSITTLNAGGLVINLKIFKGYDDPSTNSNICGTFSQTLSDPTSIAAGDRQNLNLSAFSGSTCAFTAGEHLLFSYCAACGNFVGNLNIKYEFKIT
jgi:hypothetical protein